MAEKISDNVGKKIVEALKMQNKPAEQEPISIEEEAFATEMPEPQAFEHKDAIEVQPESSNSELPYVDMETFAKQGFKKSPTEQNFTEIEQQESEIPYVDMETFVKQGFKKSELENVFQNSINQNLGLNTFTNIESDVEYPNNVAILNHLISKLPAGVSKQTGALIIRQTMEALGISMKSVIQEALQVQDNLSDRARECQKNIIDYKKQIATLETKSQQYQKQAVTMHDIINLFKSTGI